MAGHGQCQEAGETPSKEESSHLCHNSPLRNSDLGSLPVLATIYDHLEPSTYEPIIAHLLPSALASSSLLGSTQAAFLTLQALHGTSGKASSWTASVRPSCSSDLHFLSPTFHYLSSPHGFLHGAILSFIIQPSA